MDRGWEHLKSGQINRAAQGLGVIEAVVTGGWLADSAAAAGIVQSGEVEPAPAKTRTDSY